MQLDTTPSARQSNDSARKLGFRVLKLTSIRSGDQCYQALPEWSRRTINNDSYWPSQCARSPHVQKSFRRLETCIVEGTKCCHQWRNAGWKQPSTREEAENHCTDYNWEQHHQCQKCLCTCNRTGQHSSIPLQWVLIHHSQHHQVTVISSLPIVTIHIYLLYCCCKRCYLYY